MRAGGRAWAILIGGAGLALPAAAQTNAPAAQAGRPDVTVEGRRLPPAEAPRSATCEAYARDPHIAAFLNIADAGTVLPYVPTRMPRNPDWTAAPTVAVGSALPDIPKQRFGWRSSPLDVQASAFLDSQAQAAAPFEGSPAAGMNTNVSYEQVALACRAAFVRGGFGPALPRPVGMVEGANDQHFAQQRQRIVGWDRTLPTAFALFEQNRFAEAQEWFRKAHAKLPLKDGGDEAALFVGKIYLQGLGAGCDPKKAVHWLKEAATAAFDPRYEMPIFDPARPAMNTAVGEAAVMLANIYRKGWPGIAADPAEARRWYARAFAVGHVAAGTVLGDLYRDGEGVPRDPARAVRHYREAAELNHSGAQLALADMLMGGEEGVRPDVSQALGWYQAAARTGNARALFALARAHDRGEGVAIDQGRAMGFYKSAAIAGHPGAMTALGTYFYEGREVARDLSVARRWFAQAADGGDADGMFDLATMMAKGEGGPRDAGAAWAWMTRAAAAGHGTAPAALRVVERGMTPAERDAGRAMLERG